MCESFTSLFSEKNKAAGKTDGFNDFKLNDSDHGSVPEYDIINEALAREV